MSIFIKEKENEWGVGEGGSKRTFFREGATPPPPRRTQNIKTNKTHQRGRAGPGLGLHDLRAGVLDALGHGRGVGLGERHLGRRLREEREDSRPGVAADDGDIHVGDVEALGLLFLFFVQFDAFG